MSGLMVREHGKGFTRRGGIRLGYHIQVIGLDERLVVVHRRRLQVAPTLTLRLLPAAPV
jgi:hypothetical protein